MLNLLISLMTATFARIQQNADIEWKFIRAATWIHYYEDRHAIPGRVTRFLNFFFGIYKIYVTNRDKLYDLSKIRIQIFFRSNSCWALDTLLIF